MPNQTRYQIEKSRHLAQKQRELDLEMNDIAILQSWQHKQNIESSEKLLHRLKFYHGEKL